MQRHNLDWNHPWGNLTSLIFYQEKIKCLSDKFHPREMRLADDIFIIPASYILHPVQHGIFQRTCAPLYLCLFSHEAATRSLRGKRQAMTHLITFSEMVFRACFAAWDPRPPTLFPFQKDKLADINTEVYSWNEDKWIWESTDKNSTKNWNGTLL